MNEKKVSFIVAIYNEQTFSECITYLSKLDIPRGFEVDIISIEKPNTIAEAYNQGLKSSDAKYKVYLNENTLIYNQNFIEDMLRVFNMNLAIGLLGVAGTKIIPTTGIVKNANQRSGKVINKATGELFIWTEGIDLYERVQTVDGCIMATQYDVPWREDLFTKDDFYDASQSIEFKRAGYLVASAKQQEAWCGISVDFTANETDRNAFLDEYSKDIFPLVSILMTTYNRPEFFKIALESAIHQTYRNIEIIIGDDSTNNDTQKVMEDYLKKYKNITYIKNKEIKQSVAMRVYMNHANILHMSKGEYVNYLNDDDVFHRDKISVMMNCFLEYPNLSLITSYRQAIDDKGKNIDSFIEKVFKENTIVKGEAAGRGILLATANFIGEPTTALVKRKNIDHNFGTYAGTSFMALIDMAQWLESLRYGDLLYISDVLSYFRIHKGQNQKDPFMLLMCGNDHLKYTYQSFEKNLYFKNEDEYLSTIDRIVNRCGVIFDPVEDLASYQKSKFYNEVIFNDFVENRKKALSLLTKTCISCSRKLHKFEPLSKLYIEKLKEFGHDPQKARLEMLNADEYACPYCEAADRERAYLLWLKKNWTSDVRLTVLDIAPRPVIENFIKANFKNVTYKTADLFMPNVDYQVDIMDMKPIKTGSVDFFICSHVLEHVTDDVKAMKELKRILTEDGQGILVVPMELAREEIDEDPNCTCVEERWKRFGQEDHIRVYSKKGFLDRISKSGLKVKEYGIDYFGESAFEENAITKTSVVYIVSK